jgi:PBP1b-binding outer membrane lipoprotein LpoB
MTYRTPLITAALLASLLTGCSKHSPAANPKVTDLGVVEFSDRTPIRHDLDGGKVCVITPTMITNGSTRQVMLATTIEQPDSTKLACPKIVAFAGSPVEIRVGDIDIHLTIGVKP